MSESATEPDLEQLPGIGRACWPSSSATCRCCSSARAISSIHCSFLRWSQPCFRWRSDPLPSSCNSVGRGSCGSLLCSRRCCRLNNLYLADFEDGSLEQLLVSPVPLSALALGKSIAHWLSSGLPLVIVCPVIAMTYQMSLAVTGVLMATLLLGTISLSLLGSIGAALTVGLHRGTALLSLLILPLAMPVLIFGARTVSLLASGDGVSGGLYFLAAYALLMISISPFATAAALRISNE